MRGARSSTMQLLTYLLPLLHLHFMRDAYSDKCNSPCSGLHLDKPSGQSTIQS
jgi:hypothetical protein